MTVADRKMIIVLMLLASGLFLIRFWPVRADRLVARVELAGRLHREIDLNKYDGKTVTLIIPKGRAKLEIKAGAIRIREMLPPEICPRKICIHAGWIRKPGETLICVPNRLVIRLVGAPNAAPVDVIAR